MSTELYFIVQMIGITVIYRMTEQLKQNQRITIKHSSDWYN